MTAGAGAGVPRARRGVAGGPSMRARDPVRADAGGENVSDQGPQETALLVSDGRGSYYAIPTVDLERYRLSAEAARDMARAVAPDTAGFLLRSSWEGPPRPPDAPGAALPEPDAAGPGFVLAVPLAALRRR